MSFLRWQKPKRTARVFADFFPQSFPGKKKPNLKVGCGTFGNGTRDKLEADTVDDMIVRRKG